MTMTIAMTMTVTTIMQITMTTSSPPSKEKLCGQRVGVYFLFLIHAQLFRIAFQLHRYTIFRSFVKVSRNFNFVYSLLDITKVRVYFDIGALCWTTSTCHAVTRFIDHHEMAAACAAYFQSCVSEKANFYHQLTFSHTVRRKKSLFHKGAAQ